MTPTNGPNHSKPAANDAESRYWASLNQEAQQKAQALAIEGWGTGTDGPARQTAQAKIAEVYYFHTDQVGLPEELSNAQGQLVWQATYKTWGNTQAEEWKLVELDGGRIHKLDEGDQPENEDKQQNLRFQGQYLDRETGLHYKPSGSTTLTSAGSYRLLRLGWKEGLTSEVIRLTRLVGLTRGA